MDFPIGLADANDHPSSRLVTKTKDGVMVRYFNRITPTFKKSK